MTRASRHAVLAGSVVASLLGSGCQDGGPAVCAPGVPAGRIQGTVRTGGIAHDAYVTATCEDPGRVATLRVNVRSDGGYAMDVPAGRYLVRLQFSGSSGESYGYSAAGLRYSYGALDTLLVDAAHSPVTANFVLASLKVHVALSAALDEETAQVNLHWRGEPAWAASRSTQLVAGAANIHQGALDLGIGGLPPGEFRAEVVAGTRYWSSSYDGEHFWIPGVADSAASPWIELRADQTTEVTGSVGQPARVQGEIGGAWQAFGISPPSLAYYAPDSSVVRGRRTVASDGTFDDTFYVPRPVKLLVSHSGVDQWIGGRDFASATVYSLAAGQTVAGIQYAESGLFVQLEAPRYAQGTMEFVLHDATTGSRVVSMIGGFEAATRLGFANLRPGTYQLSIEPESPGRSYWAPRWFDRVNSAAAAQPIVIAAVGDVTSITVMLEKGGTIAGSVHEVPGVAAHYYFYLTRADASATWGTASAYWPATTFVVQGLPDGDWKLGVQRHSPSSFSTGFNSTTYWYPGTTDWQAATVIPTRGFADVTGIDFTMPIPAR